MPYRMKRRNTFREVVVYGEDRVVFRQLVLDLTPEDVQAEILKQFNERVDQHNECMKNREETPKYCDGCSHVKPVDGELVCGVYVTTLSQYGRGVNIPRPNGCTRYTKMTEVLSICPDCSMLTTPRITLRAGSPAVERVCLRCNDADK